MTMKLSQFEQDLSIFDHAQPVGLSFGQLFLPSLKPPQVLIATIIKERDFKTLDEINFLKFVFCHNKIKWTFTKHMCVCVCVY